MAKLITTVSDQFIPRVLEPEERDVLRAYRCPAGVWTISMGLTAASGVVTPVAGMVISKEESLRLTLAALNRNYCPRVAKALPTTKPHVFDGATGFDWNTGRIHNASWVKLFKDHKFAAAEASFKQWNKGGGRVLAGLVKRREREWKLIHQGVYPGAASPASNLTTYGDHKAEFKLLGYDRIHPGGNENEVKRFQKDHGLTVDGLIGPATRAALIRAVEAKRSGQATAGGGVAGTGGAAGTDVATSPEGLDALTTEAAVWALGWGIGIAALIFAGFLVWRYRGPLFMWLPEPVKDFTEGLGVTLGRRVRT